MNLSNVTNKGVADIPKNLALLKYLSLTFFEILNEYLLNLFIA